MRARSKREAREQSLDEGHATTLQRSGEPELGLPFTVKLTLAVNAARLAVNALTLVLAHLCCNT